jgi:hypothetical protein
MDDRRSARDVAIRRLRAKRDFKMHLGAYLIVNAMLVAVWALSGQTGFWPIWLILFWGVAVAFHGWSTYFGQPFSEGEIRREIGDDDSLGGG